MFSGIVEAIGTVTAINRSLGDQILTIQVPRRWKLKKGESVAVDGVCLTVTRSAARSFTTAVTPTTLGRTTLSTLTHHSRVNLERALRVGDPLGGHFVSGHIDGIGVIQNIVDHNGERRVNVKLPARVYRTTIPRGSITLDGISLTIADRASSIITVMLTPFTLKHTNASSWQVGRRLNVECDMMVKTVYEIQRLCSNVSWCAH